MNYFSTLIKPASSLCNMRCRYCFYYDVASNRETASYGIMQEDTARALIRQAFASTPAPAQMTFAFQGGEPTMAGLPFFRFFVSEVTRHRKEGYHISYAIQTNGKLLDDEWCLFLKENDFLVGLSLDGPREIHDYQRLDAELKGTFDSVRKALHLLQHYKVSYNILTVLTKQSAKKPKSLYRFYEKSQAGYVQIIPCLKPLDEKEDKPYDLTPRLYADFLKEFFDLWYEGLINDRYISVRMFDNYVWMLKGQPAEQCGMMGFCSPQFVVEADGGVYPCDFYVLDRYQSGNVKENTFAQIRESAGTKAFMDDVIPKNPLCETCRVRPICNGGCKRYRSFYSAAENYCPQQDFLCYAYERLAAIADSMQI